MADKPVKETATQRNIRTRAETRTAVIDYGTRADVTKVRERGRQRRSVEKAKASQQIRLRQETEAARAGRERERANLAIATSRQRGIQRVQTQKDLNSLQNRNQVGTGIQKGVTGSSAWSTLMLMTTLFFVMILLYVLVTNGVAFGNVTGTVGTWIQGISSNKPLFVKREA